MVEQIEAWPHHGCVLDGLRTGLISQHTRFDSLTPDSRYFYVEVDMFDGIIVYKQWHRKAGRWYAYLYNPLTKERTTMAWAKYIMCLHLGRILDPDLETVDHINNDKSDDRLDNLQLLTRLDNTRKSAKGRTMVTLICPKCKKEFTRERRATHLVKGGKPSHCSRRCGSLGNQSARR